VKIINKTKNTVIAEEYICADSLLKRLKGLLGTKALKTGQALILDPCNSIHTFFMKYPIDVIFVNRDNKVVKIITSIPPFRLTGIYFSASYAIELPANTIKPTEISLGDSLLL